MRDERKVKQYVYKTTLRSLYDMTDSMIAELGEPDKLVRNPHWRSGPPSSLYLIARVEEWCEKNAERIEKVRAEHAKRSACMMEVARRRRDKLLDWAGSVEIEIDRLPDDLRRDASAWYAMRSSGRPDWREDRYCQDEPGYLSDGALIAYVRHNYTNYEMLLEKLQRQPGGDAAYAALKQRVNEAVKAALVRDGFIGPAEVGEPTLPGLFDVQTTET